MDVLKEAFFGGLIALVLVFFLMTFLNALSGPSPEKKEQMRKREAQRPQAQKEQSNAGCVD